MEHNVKEYSIKFKDKLKSMFFKKGKKPKLTLEELILKKTNDPNEKDLNKLFILKMTLYFLRKNNFISEVYFNLIGNDIYKIFYEILEDPKKMNDIINVFQNLNYGGNIIFLICQKIINFGKNIGSCFDLFFNIVIEDNFGLLKKFFGKNFDLIQNHNILIVKLTKFIKIRYDDDINYEELVGLFRQSKLTNQEIINDINEGFEFNKEKETEINQITFSIIPLPKEKIECEKSNNKFLAHLKQMKNLYQQLKIETPNLDYLIKNEGKIEIDYFKYKKNKDSIIDHLYDNLTQLVLNLKYNAINFDDEEKYGYLAYFDENQNKYIEGIYSIVDTNFLLRKIVDNKNNSGDDFNESDLLKDKNAFKYRALSFEYYINKVILFKKYNIKERARVIYTLKSMLDAKNIENNKKEEENTNDIEEIDGIIFQDSEKYIDLEKNCFIVDKSITYVTFTNKDKNKTIVPIINEQEMTNERYIKIKENSLSFIEIKNQFPIKKKNENEDLKKQPSTFYTIMKNLIIKAKIFMQIYEQKNKKIEHL